MKVESMQQVNSSYQSQEVLMWLRRLYRQRVVQRLPMT